MTRVQGRRKHSQASILRDQFDLVFEKICKAFERGPSALGEIEVLRRDLEKINHRLYIEIGEVKMGGWLS